MKEMTRQILSISNFNKSKDKKVSKRAYQAWRHQFSLDGIQGFSVGNSFCKHFKVADNLLRLHRDFTWTDNYINETYVK